ncbi:hypothetical protein BDW74DRAFT_153770 [Aspergillus multicolor]|uniref:uncharacterized protein n=1 Tax=Aspergillus multicolor TaxID=41759 RepID=UPI003CCDBD10
MTGCGPTNARMQAGKQRNDGEGSDCGWLILDRLCLCVTCIIIFIFQQHISMIHATVQRWRSSGHQICSMSRAMKRGYWRASSFQAY